MAPSLKDAPGLPDEVVKPFVAADMAWPSVPHGGLDVLDREESCALPVRGLRFSFGHGCEPLGCTAYAWPRGRSWFALSEREGPGVLSPPGPTRPDRAAGGGLTWRRPLKAPMAPSSFEGASGAIIVEEG